MRRREFVGTAAALLLGACARARGIGAAAGRLPIGFSTLGSPRWAWLATLDFAAAHGFAAVELRGLQETMDLSQRPEFQPARLARTRRELADRSLVVPCLGASIALHERDAVALARSMAETRRFIDLASGLGSPYVRVFGDRYVAGTSREETLARVAGGLRELGEYARPRGVTVLLESHGEFVDSATLAELMGRADSPGVAILWDAHHTFVAGESPAATVAALGRFIRHTHLKDSLPAASGRRYVLTGRGEVPVRLQVEALAGIGYRGYYSLEWEKRWHPEIEEPEVAFPQYAEVMAGYLRGAGATRTG